MSCATCEDTGLWPFVDADNPTPDDAIAAADLCFALCLCRAAVWFRSDRNRGRRTGFCGWQVWCARHQVEPSRIYLLEEVLTPEELAAVGFNKPAEGQPASREAALLAAGKTRKGKL